MHEAGELEADAPPGTRWPGVLLSLFVPGFGHFRAGDLNRGIAWLLGVALGLAACAYLLAYERIPLWLALALPVIGYVCMLVANCQPGRMTPKRWMLFGLLLAAILILPRPDELVVRPFKIPTGAMEPTLMGIREGSTPDHVFANRFIYRFSEPKRGDLVTFSTRGIAGIRLPPGMEQFYVKRVIGLPGERIEIRGGAIHADGVRLGENDGIPPIEYVNLSPNFPHQAQKQDGAYVVGEDEYFVLGDNSLISADSRVWGNVPAENIDGKVTKIYWPPSRWGTPE